MEMVVHERNALRRKLQKVEKACTCLAVAHEDALAVLREFIPAAVSGDTPPPAANAYRIILWLGGIIIPAIDEVTVTFTE